VGKQALEVLRELKSDFTVTGLSGNSSLALLLEQAGEFRPQAVAVASSAPDDSFRKGLDRIGSRLLDGPDSPAAMIRILRPDIVLQAVSGAAGLPPSIAAVEEGARLALANKESLVMAGHLLMPLAAEKGSEIIPVDSEHSAIFQALECSGRDAARRIYLTASGGPFIDTPAARLAEVTPAEALRHPTWDMGGKITIDSATMMNKALEIIEARWLFDFEPADIEIVVHRQSIVHSMVEFKDGSIIAQMGTPDMRVPIRYALTYPERPPSDRCYFDFERWKRLTFEPPDRERFPAIDLGFRAARSAGISGAVLNAANEAAVNLFLEGSLAFDEIAAGVGKVLDRTQEMENSSLEAILEADRWAREEIIRCC
jgi:1-deoxy-D-xylulose-5-phosphate reductoisomerase